MAKVERMGRGLRLGEITIGGMTLRAYIEGTRGGGGKAGKRYFVLIEVPEDESEIMLLFRRFKRATSAGHFPNLGVHAFNVDSPNGIPGTSYKSALDQLERDLNAAYRREMTGTLKRRAA